MESLPHDWWRQEETLNTKKNHFHSKMKHITIIANRFQGKTLHLRVLCTYPNPDKMCYIRDCARGEKYYNKIFFWVNFSSEVLAEVNRKFLNGSARPKIYQSGLHPHLINFRLLWILHFKKGVRILKTKRRRNIIGEKDDASVNLDCFNGDFWVRILYISSNLSILRKTKLYG